MSPVIKGTTAMILGVSILSVDSLLIRLVESSGWTLLFWRGLISSFVITLFLLVSGKATSFRALKKPPLSLLLGSVAFSLSTVCFVLSIGNTQVASTLIIINLSPLISAILALIILKEKIELRTAIAIVSAISGVIFVFSDQSFPNASFGNLMALVTAFTLAFYFVILRYSQGANTALFLIIGGLFTATISFFAGAEPMSLNAKEWMYVLILCAGVVPVSFLLISSGPRYLPAAHANLFMLLEAILGPLFVWIVIGEVPTEKVLVGGSVVMVTLVLFTLSSAHKSRKSKPDLV